MEKRYLNKFMKLKNSRAIFENELLLDFIKKLVMCTAVIYLIFFALESVLPGIVIEVFNFNLLLFAIVGMMTFILYADNQKPVKEGATKESSWQKITIFLALVFLFTMFVVLYRVSLIEAGIYAISSLFLLKYLRTLFE
jgi:hypothetical protein